MPNGQSIPAKQISAKAQEAVQKVLDRKFGKPSFDLGPARLPPWVMGFMLQLPDASLKEVKDAASKAVEAIGPEARGGKPAAVIENDHLILGFIGPRETAPNA
jgi:hypothetical protein